MALGVVALLVLSAALVLAVDPAQRLTVMVALGVAYAVLAIWLLRVAQSAWRAPTDGAFALSRAELRRDSHALRPPSP